MRTDQRSSVDAGPIDESFDGIQRIFTVDLIEKRGLADARIERWRWDEPAIALAWVDRDRGWIAKSLCCVANLDYRAAAVAFVLRHGLA